MAVSELPIRHGITGLDHPVIAVNHMAASRKVFERLGFTVPPRGSHVEWGTGNWCIMFPDDYIELRGILDPDRETLGLEKTLAERGEGLMGVALGSDDIVASRASMEADGLRPGPIRHLTRNFELEEGWVKPRFALFLPDGMDIHGIPHVVVLQHRTPELIRRPDFLVHANGAHKVVELVGAIDDPDGVAQAQERLLGEGAVRRDGDSVRLSFSRGQCIRLESLEALRREYASALPERLPPLPYMAALTVAVTDVDRATAALDAGDVPFEVIAEQRLRVGAADACGAIIDFQG